MKKVFIINAHWNNRGDEAALRSLVDRLVQENIKVSIQFQSSKIEQFPYNNIFYIEEYPRLREIPRFILGVISNGKLGNSKFKEFYKELKEADLVLHAPGGPSIGDIYSVKEPTYIVKLWAAKFYNIPYMFCAPSAGPFKKRFLNIFRRYIYNNAEQIVFREEISQNYYKKLNCKESKVTCDLALRNEIDIEKQRKILDEDSSLTTFLKKYKKIVGITITDLVWHPKYSKDLEVAKRVKNSFLEFIDFLYKKDYGIIFIPQQFGLATDCKYMNGFAKNNCFMLDNDYDCYLQQYLISKLYAVVGMRYHSNIFSAKMGTPFISISYEQKMKGFIKKIDYTDYCIDIDELSESVLKEKFLQLEVHYEEIKSLLESESIILKDLSNVTTDLIINYLNKE